LPDISGPDVMACLKLKGTLPPVLFLTGRDAEEDVVQVIQAGADDYMVKPPSRSVLIARIHGAALLGAWSWRRLEGAGCFLDHELKRQRQELGRWPMPSRGCCRTTRSRRVSSRLQAAAPISRTAEQTRAADWGCISCAPWRKNTAAQSSLQANREHSAASPCGCHSRDCHLR